MKNQLIKKILIIVMIMLSIYITIECIKSATVTVIKHGLLFTSYSTVFPTGWVSRTNKLFDSIIIWKMTTE